MLLFIYIYVQIYIGAMSHESQGTATANDAGIDAAPGSFFYVLKTFLYVALLSISLQQALMFAPKAIQRFSNCMQYL